MALTPTQIYGYINAAYSRLGYGAGNDPITWDDSNIEQIGALPASQLQTLFDEFNILLTERWFTNSINESAKGIARFIFRNNGAHGFSIVDRFANLLTASAYPVTDSAIAENLVSRAADPVDVKRFTRPFAPGQFKTTIDFQQFRKFLTPGGLAQYVTLLENNLYQSAEYAMLAEIVDMFEASVDGENIVIKDGYDMNTEAGLRVMVEDMMTAVDAMKQPTDLYNAGGRIISTPDAADIVIITTPSRWNRVKAHLFSDVYNLEQLAIDGRVIFAPEGSDLGSHTTGGTEYPCQFIVADARAYAIEITTLEVRPFEVSNMNWRNLFLHVEGVEGQTPFANAVAFCGDFGTFLDGVPVPHTLFGYGLDGECIDVTVTVDGQDIEQKDDAYFTSLSYGVGPGGGVITYLDGGNRIYSGKYGGNTDAHPVTDSVKIAIAPKRDIQTTWVGFMKVIVQKADGTIEVEEFSGYSDPETLEYPVDYFINISLLYICESQG